MCLVSAISLSISFLQIHFEPLAAEGNFEARGQRATLSVIHVNITASAISRH